MKICISKRSYEGSELDLLHLAYAAFFASRAHSVTVIYLGNGLNFLIDIKDKKLSEEFKKIIFSQTGIDITNLKNCIEVIELLNKKYNVIFKACESSRILLNLDKTGIEEATMHEIVREIIESNLRLDF